MFSALRDPDSLPPESVFVYGKHSIANSTLAVGLAGRRHGSFSWADCAASAGNHSRGSRGLFAQGMSRRAGDGVDPSDWVVRRWSADTVERVLVPENRMDSIHLMSYLALPALLQELAAMSTSPSGESFIILTNIDALDRRLRASAFGRADVHHRLHDEKVSLFVTARTRPTSAEAANFNRILRVEAPRNAVWSDGMVHIEKDLASLRRHQSMSVRAVWRHLELDPTLLPPP